MNQINKQQKITEFQFDILDEPIGNAGTDSSTEPVYCHVNKIVVQLLFFDFTSSLAHFKLILLGNQVVNITGNMMDDQKNQFKVSKPR